MNSSPHKKTIIISPGRNEPISSLILQKLASLGTVLIGSENEENLGLLLSENLKSHGLMVSSTDTIPGLICPFDDQEKIDIIYKIKNRAKTKKLLILASSTQMALDFCPKGWLTPRIQKFCDSIWPNPVTLILPLNPIHQDLFRQGNREKKHQNESESMLTYAVRVPASPWLRVLMAKMAKPLVAPSANISGEAVPESLIKIIQTFENWIDLYFFSNEDLILNNQPGFENGPPGARGASAIIDISNESPQIIRPGNFNQKKISKLWEASNIN